MRRNVRSIGVTVATLTSLTGFAVGEAAQHYDDSKKAVYATQQLQEWCDIVENKNTSDESDAKQMRTSAWLGSARPKFPYLLSISSGDNPAIVTNKCVRGLSVCTTLTDCVTDEVLRCAKQTFWRCKSAWIL